MAQPKSLVGLPAPLFEKLIDLQPNSAEDDQDLVFQTRDAVCGSIMREISRLVDTRLSWPEMQSKAPPSPDGAEGFASERTVLRYGVPDFTHLSVRSPSDRRSIERLVTEAIRAFEPRLKNPQVSLVFVAAQDRGKLEISGQVAFGRSLEPMTFALDVTVKLDGETRRKMAVAEKARDRGKRPAD